MEEDWRHNWSEVRRGDARVLDITVPNAFVGTVDGQIAPIIQFDDRAKVWLVALSLEWLNPQEGVALDELNGDFFIQYGVGSARINNIRNLSLVQGAALAINVVDTRFELPAASMAIQGRLRYVAVAGAARTLQARIVAMAAPFTRGHNQ